MSLLYSIIIFICTAFLGWLAVTMVMLTIFEVDIIIIDGLVKITIGKEI